MSRGARVALGVAAVLQVLGIVACSLLAIWGGDGRWVQTALLLLLTAAVTTGAATFPGGP